MRPGERGRAAGTLHEEAEVARPRRIEGIGPGVTGAIARIDRYNAGRVSTGRGELQRHGLQS